MCMSVCVPLWDSALFQCSIRCLSLFSSVLFDRFEANPAGCAEGVGLSLPMQPRLYTLARPAGLFKVSIAVGARKSSMNRLNPVLICNKSGNCRRKPASGVLLFVHGFPSRRPGAVLPAVHAAGSLFP